MDPSTLPTSTPPILTQCQNCQIWQPVVGFTMTECPRKVFYEGREWVCSMFAMSTEWKRIVPYATEECLPEPITDIPNPEPCTSGIVTREFGYMCPNFATC